jgi:hypothetical protein
VVAGTRKMAGDVVRNKWISNMLRIELSSLKESSVKVEKKKI